MKKNVFYSCFVLVFTFSLSNTVSFAQTHKWELHNQIQRFLVGTGDYVGWRVAMGTKRNLSPRWRLGADVAVWIYEGRKNEPRFRDIYGYPTIDIHPENYPLPELFIPHEEQTDYGIVNYTPQDEFWQARSVDVYAEYSVIDSPKWLFSIGGGVSSIYVDATFIADEWSQTLDVWWDFADTDYDVRFLVPLYVRYLDIGSKMSLDVAYKFTDRWRLGAGLTWYEYLNSRNSTVGVSISVGL